MPKISLIGWVWNFALFWQLISCYELSSCHKKVLTPEMDWGIWNLTVCQKSVWLVEFEISPYFDSLSVVMSCQVVIKKIFTPEIDWGIANPTYAKNQLDWWSLKFPPILTAYQLLRAVKLSKKNFDFRNWLRAYESSFVTNSTSFTQVHQTLPVGWLAGRGKWEIMLSSSLVFGAWKLEIECICFYLQICMMGVLT